MDDVGLRPAARSDAAHMALLVDAASEGMSSHMWREMAGIAEAPTIIGRARALREDADFSYRNTTMAEVGGEIAGCLIGFVHPEERNDIGDVPPFLQPLYELGHVIVGYWYVNVLAVYPEFRSTGVGSALLKAAETKAWESGAPGLALIVASGNQAARRLYDHFGYREKERRAAAAWPKSRAGQEWILMTKPVEAPDGR